jgi:GxxExxY protein
MTDGPDNPINLLTREIISAAIEVHRELGPGLLESAYEACLVHELTDRGVSLERQKPLPVVYHGVELDCGYRIDLLVEKSVIVELKSVEAVERIHCMQLLSYLRLSGHKVGLLINFNVPVLTNGVRRIVNNFKE